MCKGMWWASMPEGKITDLFTDPFQICSFLM